MVARNALVLVSGDVRELPAGDTLNGGGGAPAGNPVVIGSVTTGTAPTATHIVGPYAYVVNQTSNTLQIIDVSTPTAPVVIGSVATGTAPSYIYVSGKYAYVVNSTSATLQVIDISNCASPAVVGSVATGANPQWVSVSGKYVFVVSYGAGTLQVVDISIPTAPIVVGSVSVGASAQSAYVLGRYVYVASYGTGFLKVVDILVPTTPAVVGSVAIADAQAVYVSGRYAYVVQVSSSKFKVVDISVPTAPVVVGSVSLGTAAFVGTQAVFVSGQYAYITDQWMNTLRVIDVSVPTTPAIVGSVATGTDPTGLFVVGRYAYVCNKTTNTLQVFDIGGFNYIAANIGSLEAGNIKVRNDLQVGGELQVASGLTVAGAFLVNGVSIGTPAGSTTQVQFNNAGAFGASSNFTYNNVTNTLTIAGIVVSNGVTLAGVTPPAGSTTQVQFNNAGAFGGDADLTWTPATNTLTLGGTNTTLVMNAITTEPASPPAGMLTYYSKNFAGRVMPKVKGPSGLDYSLQAAVWANTGYLWSTTTTTTGLWAYTVGAGAGTYTTALPTTTSIYTAIKRARWANVATTTNQVLGQRNTEAIFFRGAVANQGGFFFQARGGFDVWTNGGRFFAGMHSATTVVSADPSALNNTVGFCVDAADNGAISFLTRGTVATKTATGMTITSGKGYDLFIFCAANSSQYGWRIVDLNTGTEASGTATLNLPTNTTMLTAGFLASNAALATVTAIHLGCSKIYIETDY